VTAPAATATGTARMRGPDRTTLATPPLMHAPSKTVRPRNKRTPHSQAPRAGPNAERKLRGGIDPAARRGHDGRHAYLASVPRGSRRHAAPPPRPAHRHGRDR